MEPSPEESLRQVRLIPILENDEPLVDLLTFSSRLFWVPRHPAFAYERRRLLREGAARRLGIAAEALPSGLLLAVVEGWRAPEIQAHMRAATRQRLSHEHPEWSPRYLSRMINRFSAPSDSRSPAPHTTGGAVDVSLVTLDGEHLDLTSPYPPVDGRSAPAFAPGLSQAAQENRRILREAMLSSGFTNYPMEWWHWSYGDQAWAYRGRHSSAVYGLVLPEDHDPSEIEFTVHEQPGF